jgi:hypothetical protein
VKRFCEIEAQRLCPYDKGDSRYAGWMADFMTGVHHAATHRSSKPPPDERADQHQGLMVIPDK